MASDSSVPVLSWSVTWRLLLLAFVAYLIPCFFRLPSPVSFTPVIKTPIIPSPVVIHIDPDITPSDSTFLNDHEQQITAGLHEFDGVNSNLSKAIDAVNEKVALVEKAISSHPGSSPPNLPKPTFPSVAEMEDSIASAVSSDVRNDEQIPLIIRSITSNSEKAGTRAIDLIFDRNPLERLTEGVGRNHENLLCISGTAATFLFWSPYPLWGSRFEVIEARGIFEARLVLKLEKEIVWESPIIRADDGKFRFAVGGVRFREVELITFSNSQKEICIGNLTAFAHPRVQ
jgi:hypothetical protein